MTFPSYTLHWYVRTKVVEQGALFDEQFSDPEKRNILGVLNSCSEVELTFTKQFNKAKASALVSYRQKNGDFASITSVLRVPGIGVPGLQKLCMLLKDKDYESIQKLQPVESVETVRSYPYLSPKQCDEVESVISLEVQPDRVSWVRVNRDLRVEDWKQSVLFDRPYSRFDHVVYLEQVHNFVKSLPKCSVYTMENKQYRVPSLRVMPLIVSLKCLETMLISVLNSDYSETQQQRVYLIKSNVISRYFKLLVGGERVSGQHVVREILNHNSDSLSDVIIPPGISDGYFRRDHIEQEKLSSCLLQAVAFLKLIVLKEDTISV